MADLKLLTKVDSFDLEAAIEQVVNSDSDDFFAVAHTLGLNPLQDFEASDLRGITLSPRSNLEEAKLRSTDFEDACLEEVFFVGADLSYANLSGANLSKANLVASNLSFTNLNGADLASANLFGADLENASFTNTYGLEIAQIKVAKNWQKAYYDPDFREQLRVWYRSWQLSITSARTTARIAF